MFSISLIYKGKPVQNTTKEDVLSYLKGRRNKSEKYKFMLKLYLKNFLKWLRLKELSDWVGCKASKYKIEDDKFLTISQIQAMISAASNPRDKALVATLYESGARIGESLSAKVRDIAFRKSKTKQRKIRLCKFSTFN